MQVGPVAFADKVTIENQHFVDKPSLLVSVVDDDRRDAHIDGFHVEMPVGQTIKANGPVPAQLVLTADHTAAFGSTSAANGEANVTSS